MNSVVSLAKMGCVCYYFTRIGVDRVGDMLLGIMRELGVATDYIVRNMSQTTVSFGYLDEQNNATYEWYRGRELYPAPFDYSVSPKTTFALISGSYTRRPENRVDMVALLEHCAANGVQIYYDVNPREPIDICSDMEELLRRCTYVKVSTDDLQLLPQGFVEQCPPGLTVLITGQRSVRAYRGGQMVLEVPCAEIIPVCTVGAGDSFNAGFLSCAGTLEERVAAGI